MAIWRTSLIGVEHLRIRRSDSAVRAATRLKQRLLELPVLRFEPIKSLLPLIDTRRDIEVVARFRC